MSLAHACPWRVRVLGVCVLLIYACPWCVCVQAVCGPMCVAGEGLPSVTWMPHCWGLCTHPAPLLPHGRGLPVSFLTSCFPGGHRTILRVLPLPSLGAGGRQENTGAGFEGGKGASDWTSVKLGSIWAQRVLRPGRLGHTGKWTACPCIAAHHSVTGAHGVGSRGRAGGSLSISGEACPVLCPWLPSLRGDWLPPTQGPGRIPLPVAAGLRLWVLTAASQGSSSGSRDHRVPPVLAQPCRGGGSFSCSGSRTSPPASSSVWGPRVMTGFHPITQDTLPTLTSAPQLPTSPKSLTAVPRSVSGG